MFGWRRIALAGVLMGWALMANGQVQPHPAYWIIVGSYTNPNRATAAAQQLVAQGLAVAIQPDVILPDVYRLGIGPYADRQSATLALPGLMQRLRRFDLWVLGPKGPAPQPPLPPTSADTTPPPAPVKLDTAALLRALQQQLTPTQPVASPTPQRDSIPAPPPGLQFEGYVDVYLAVDDDASATDRRQYSAVASRKGEFALNTAQITAKYQSDRLRGRITLQTGTIRETSWDGLTQNPLVQEAWVGWRLGPDWWLDGGFFLTHIGGEALLPKDNLLSLQSLVTTYEPFYQLGFRLSKTWRDRWLIQLLVLNGYNLFEDNNPQKSVGWLVQYNRKKWQFSYSGLAGNEQPSGSQQSVRVYQDLVVNWQPTPRWQHRLLVDYGQQQRLAIDTLGRAIGLLGAAVISRYQLTDRLALSTRTEYFDDKANIVLANIRGWGFTVGGEYRPVPNLYLRLEARQLELLKSDPVFAQPDGTRSRIRREVVLSMGVYF